MGTSAKPQAERCRAAAVTGLLCAAVLLCVAPAARAQESFEFRTPGADEMLGDELRAASLLLTARDEGTQDPQELFSIARAEYGRLIGVLYEYGHYGGTIEIRLNGREAAEISPLYAPGQIESIMVTVEPGPQFSFGATEIAPLAPQTVLPEGFATGAPAFSPVVRDAAQAGVEGWRAHGHALAEVESQDITADHADATLDTDIRLAPGDRLRFGTLSVEGHERMRPERIREIAGFPTGEVFDPENVERASRRLRRSGVFASVALREAETANPDGTLDIAATVTEAPLRRIGFGIEADSLDGGRVTGFWLHRNLLGGGERLRFDGEIGGIGARDYGLDLRVTSRLSRPATFSPDTTFFIGTLVETVDAPDFDARRLEVETGLSHIFSPTLTGEAALSYRFERTEDDLGTRDFGMLATPVGATWDRRDDSLDPTDGTYLEASLIPYLGFETSDTGLQFTTDARAYYGLGAEDRLVVAGRAQLGGVAFADLDDTPRQLLFYSGGAGTVRGVPFRSLGVSPGGVRSGGQGFAAFSGELRGSVTETIGLVGFADAGYVSEGLFTGEDDWHAGAGVGLRYNTGIGPLRLDVAAPVRGEEGGGVQIYLGLGQAF